MRQLQRQQREAGDVAAVDVHVVVVVDVVMTDDVDVADLTAKVPVVRLYYYYRRVYDEEQKVEKMVALLSGQPFIQFLWCVGESSR